MTQLIQTKNATSTDDHRGANEGDPILDLQQLAADLFDKVASTQVDLLRARAMGDPQAADEHLLRLRGAALLLTCLPAHPDSDAHRLKVLVAVALREEDGQEASHAWSMVEHAIRLDQQRYPSPARAG